MSSTLHCATDVINVGVLSTASISNVFCNAVASAAIPGVSITALGTRTPSSKQAHAFASKYSIAHVSDYQTLIDNPTVHALYIPLPTGLSTPYALAAVRAGKHVLVDKPFVTVLAAREIAVAAAEAGVAFLDGTHFVHSKRLQVAKEQIKLVGGGDVVKVIASFTHPIDVSEPGSIRVNIHLEPDGVVGDICWYVD
jgi:predicted dehydrogenase